MVSQTATQEQVEFNYLTCARSLRQMACQQTCMNYPLLEFLKRGKFQVDFSEHLGLTIRACLLIASGGKWKLYLCFVSIAAMQKSFDCFQLKETELLSPPTESWGGDKEKKHGCHFKRLLGSGRRVCLSPQEIPPEVQLGRGCNVRAAAKGATGPCHTPPARNQGELGTGKKGPRTFRNAHFLTFLLPNLSKFYFLPCKIGIIVLPLFIHRAVFRIQGVHAWEKKAYKVAYKKFSVTIRDCTIAIVILFFPQLLSAFVTKAQNKTMGCKIIAFS